MYVLFYCSIKKNTKVVKLEIFLRIEKIYVIFVNKHLLELMNYFRSIRRDYKT